MMEIVDKNLVFSSFYTVREICVSAKIWFVKTSNRIVKYKSRVVQSNPTSLSNLFNFLCSNNACSFFHGLHIHSQYSYSFPYSFLG